MSLTVQELFQKLSYGELSNLHMGAEGTGTIDESKIPSVILYANEALLKLHSRFILIEKDLNLELFSHITNYHFLNRYTESRREQYNTRYPYIKDLINERFDEDLIRVLTVTDKYGKPLPLNDSANPLSVFTPQPRTLQVPRPVTGMSLAVQYQARHPKLKGEDPDELIDIPDTLEVALTAYIAYNVFCTIATPESTAKAQEHLARYEATCMEVENKDLVSTSVSGTNSRFEKNGWA